MSLRLNCLKFYKKLQNNTNLIGKNTPSFIFLPKLYTTPRTLFLMLKLFASGTFNAKAYREANASLKGMSTFRCYLHWVRYGNYEDRPSGKNIKENWLLRKVTQDELSLIAARKLLKSQHNPKWLEECRDAKLCVSEYNYFKSYSEQLYEDAWEHLERTSLSFRLQEIRRSLRRIPVVNMENLFATLKLEIVTIETDSLNIDSIIAFRDIAQAMGCSWQEVVAWNKQIISRVKQDGLLQSRHQINLLSVKKDNLKVYGKSILFREIAAENAVLDQGLKAIKQDSDKKFYLIDADKKSVIIFIPDSSCWLSNMEAMKTVIEGFKLFVNSVTNHGYSIIPLPMPYTRDLSLCDFPAFKILSYHTYAIGRSDIFHYKEASIANFIHFDSMGFSGGSKPLSYKEITDNRYCLERYNQLQDLYMKGKSSKYIFDTVKEDIPFDKYIALILQVPDDSVSRWQALFPLETLKIVTEFCKVTDVNLVVRPHPLDNSQFTQQCLRKLQTYPNVHISLGKLEPVLQNAEFIIVGNSGVGLEALLLDKLVISTGLSEYVSATIYCSDKTSLLHSLKLFANDTLQLPSKQRRAIIGHLFNHQMFNVKEKSSENKFVHNIIKAFLEDT